MNKSQFSTLMSTVAEAKQASISLLMDRTPRTLIYGYTIQRDTFHVYLAQDGIHCVIYNYNKLLMQHTHEHNGLQLSQCVPDKRVYPETCDLEFCSVLLNAGVHVPFTSWTDRDPTPFYGKQLHELVTKYTPADFTFEVAPFVTCFTEMLAPRSEIQMMLIKQLADSVQNVAQSYLMARVPELSPDTATARKWLDNLPGSLDYVIADFNRDNILGEELTLSDQQRVTISTLVEDVVCTRLTALLTR